MSTGTANFLSGGLGAFSFWVMAIPADNIKKCVANDRLLILAVCLHVFDSRMMSYPYPRPYSSLASPASVVNLRPSFIRTVRQIALENGIAGFYRGLGPCLLRAFPVNACAFFVYEGTMRLIGAEKVSEAESLDLR